MWRSYAVVIASRTRYWSIHQPRQWIGNMMGLKLNHVGAEEESKSDLESELCCIKEQLRSAEDNIAYLSEWVKTYRHRWMEEYYRAENLELHMPYGICVPDLDQIPEGAASPKLFAEWSSDTVGAGAGHSNEL
ncbi:hypothetical protein BDR04DRAFT_1118828 [Suillus decipiens]|nr:hypothetical protein BDR04DRAFT_1118828 [Suillus decipiens]